ncbi:MAG: hypothetical protein LH624_18950 [Cryobacterium sp.]|nr:hypothetical protein [Cryobacterium sp.]
MSKNSKMARHANTGLTDKQQIEKIIADITAERQSASGQLSTQSRAIALGVLAVAWLLLGGTQQPLSERFAGFNESLLWIAAVCVVSLVADFLQYSFTLHETNLALGDSHKAKTADEAGYDDPSWLRRISNACFLLKLSASLFAAGWLLYVIYRGLTA